MARKRKQQDSGGGYSWMDTYGDLVTLLLCFFVLLYSFSSVDSKKWEELVMALSGGPREVVVTEPLDPNAPNEMLDFVSSDEDSALEQQRQEQRERMSELYQQLSGYASENGLENEIEVSMQDTGIKVSFVGDIFFDSGSDVIKPEAREQLNVIIPMLEQYTDNISEIRIEGHTDTDYIETARFPDNIILSCYRARNVRNYIDENSSMGQHIRLSQAGYGPDVPVAPNDTQENKAKNRRVEFNIIEKVILRSSEQ